MWNNSNSYILLVGMQDDIATLENKLAVSLKFKHTPSRSTLMYLSESQTTIQRFVPNYSYQLHL